MNMVVCIKQVPDTTDVKIDKKTGTIVREGVPSVINPSDKNAIEEALLLREKFGGKVTVITMGPPQSREALQETLAMGVDKTILLTDRKFAGADTLATSYTLAQGIKKLEEEEKFDIILCGSKSIDGDTAQTPIELAETLNIPQITYATNIVIRDKKVRAIRDVDDGYEVIESEMPVLITILKEINTPRYPTIKGIVQSFQKGDITVWSAKAINVDESKIGLSGSATQVKKVFTPENSKKGIILQGDPKEIVDGIIKQLQKINLI
ncbi:MAG: electron transfer flavoprotein subunit beta/FixA family protein [Candidatus Helarchaeota archaeon]|nr:electron transfer flavoprotein subunit beta/FixA family protein [Candidatus Helarchaeota archaeon]